MYKLVTYLLGSLATAMGLALIFTLNIFLIPLLGYWMIALDLVYLVAGLALISYVGDLSIPVIRTLLKREYYRIKFKTDKKGAKGTPGFYLKFLASLIVLFKSADAGYVVIKDEAHELHGKALLFIEKEKGNATTKASHKQLFNVHKTKQRRAATISAGTLILLVIGSVIVGLLSSLIFPAIFQSQAATFTWTQSSWSTSTTNVAVHPDDGLWTEYASKDSNITIDGSGNITMTSGSQDMVDNTDANFSLGDFKDAASADDRTQFVDQNNLTDWPLLVKNGSVVMPHLIEGPCYDSRGILVLESDLNSRYDWTSAKSACTALGLSLPTEPELACICANKNSYRSGEFNPSAGVYWSSTPSYGAYFVRFSDCYSYYVSNTYNAYSVRCVRR